MKTFVFAVILFQIIGHTYNAQASDQQCTKENVSVCLKKADELIKSGKTAEASPLLEAACTLGKAIPCANAALFAMNRGEEKKAASLFEKGCNLGDMPSCSSLGTIVVKQDSARAKQLFDKGCQAGDGQGCFNLGIWYGEAKNQQKKSEYWSRACSLAYSQACESLGLYPCETGSFTTDLKSLGLALSVSQLKVVACRPNKDMGYGAAYQVPGKSIELRFAVRTTPKDILNPPKNSTVISEKAYFPGEVQAVALNVSQKEKVELKPASASLEKAVNSSASLQATSGAKSDFSRGFKTVGITALHYDKRGTLYLFVLGDRTEEIEKFMNSDFQKLLASAAK